MTVDNDMDDKFNLPRASGVEILRSEVGSTLHGTGLPGGEDYDEMGIFLEHPATTVGLGHIEHYTARSKPEGVRSEPGDTDLVIYSARKWAKLALGGNPSVLLLLHAPDDKLTRQSEQGAYIRAHANWFASRRAGWAFLGYMQRQRSRMTGERGRAGRVRDLGVCLRCNGSGAEPQGAEKSAIQLKCFECHGLGKHVDWKYAMHMLRLGHQGVEYLHTGRLTLPIPPEIGDGLRAVRRGDVSITDVILQAESLEAQLKRLLDGDSPLPAQPNTEKVERWLINAHLEMWRSTLR